MDMELRNKMKRKGMKRFFNSFKYSWDGLAYAFAKEQSVTIVAIFTVIAIILGIVLKIDTMEWIIVVIMIGIILGTELINTAIEATIDLVSPAIHPLAKIAKDTASAAVFVYSMISAILGAIIFIPNLLQMLGL